MYLCSNAVTQSPPGLIPKFLIISNNHWDSCHSINIDKHIYIYVHTYVTAMPDWYPGSTFNISAQILPVPAGCVLSLLAICDRDCDGVKFQRLLHVENLIPHFCAKHSYINSCVLYSCIYTYIYEDRDHLAFKISIPLTHLNSDHLNSSSTRDHSIGPRYPGKKSRDEEASKPREIE